jgi:hypothetical protein
MERSAEFVNLYISKMMDQITQLTKENLIHQTNIALQEQMIKTLTEHCQKLEEAVNKVNKKKLKTDESNTF